MDVDAALQSQIRNIEATYGKPLDHWFAVIDAFVAPGKAAARSSLPPSQRSRSWTAWVMTTLGIDPPQRDSH